MFYHPFKKTVKSKAGKTTKRWYYWWKDPITGIQHQIKMDCPKETARLL